MILAVFIGVLLLLQGASPFTNKQCIRNNDDRRLRELAAEPRAGIGQALLNVALKSPVWAYVLVPQARASIVKTAEENDIPWTKAKTWLKSHKGAPWNDEHRRVEVESEAEYPEYYRRSFHAYEDGNLSYDAAIEQELASRSIGARNFPAYGERGEDVFRDAFDIGLSKLGAQVKSNDDGSAMVVDFGCGTGTSTRRLAKQYPGATRLVGIDLSPYFIDVGTTLLKLAPNAVGIGEDGQEGWITSIDADDRIDLRQGDVARTGLPDDSVSVVNLSLVMHELPVSAAKDVVDEAFRILQPGGQMWISEMDFESPAYAAQRENAMLFSLLRATEPYLDEYADSMEEMREYITELFGELKITAATGRHYALIATKLSREDKGEGVIEDTRFKPDGSYGLDDTHLRPWESKQTDIRK
ncbi:hypothetical protein THAOC_00753 [Thalassiosira oceanica]|uniref:Methyltransferase type 11 domain-containing protein n=1 Tax=Thalassiosira oceanica TaxID=159749 RepID=K0TF65_THAOC|nr:hypothetical protein THAOC_00753 [Thalassiosira oceanica]|eukprot:EJK77418.1 hypothetical protein THAOC_00753 [Thalassiosira oceanica]